MTSPYLLDVVESLGLTPADNILPKTVEDDVVEGSGEVKTRYYTKKSSNTRLRTTSDEHNEVCEICERGGDLLCCDTCTLVYHLPCVRPRLNNVPRGAWSCAHCILDVRTHCAVTHSQTQPKAFYTLKLICRAPSKAICRQHDERFVRWRVWSWVWRRTMRTM